MAIALTRTAAFVGKPIEPLVAQRLAASRFNRTIAGVKTDPHS
jgi:hypothetical protein